MIIFRTQKNEAAESAEDFEVKLFNEANNEVKLFLRVNDEMKFFCRTMIIFLNNKLRLEDSMIIMSLLNITVLNTDFIAFS